MGIVLNYCQYGVLYLGSYYNTGPYINFPHFGNSNLGKLPHAGITTRAPTFRASRSRPSRTASALLRGSGAECSFQQAGCRFGLLDISQAAAPTSLCWRWLDCPSSAATPSTSSSSPTHCLLYRQQSWEACFATRIKARFFHK